MCRQRTFTGWSEAVTSTTAAWRSRRRSSPATPGRAACSWSDSDDPATGLDDLAGADYGYINTSCTSSYFSPAILVTRLGKTWDKFLHFVPVPAWQGQIDAVVSKKVRATMVLEDVWRATPENAETTKVIGRYDNCKPPVVIARKDLDDGTRGTLLDALVAWEPDWNGIFGGLKPYYYADVHPFFHDLDQLPAGM